MFLCNFYILLLIIIILLIKYKFSYWKRQKIPYLQPHFIFGNIKPLLQSKQSVGTSIFNIYRQFQRRNVKLGGFYMLTTPALIILDPELIRNILIKDFHYFHDRNVYSNVKTDPLSGHIFAAEGPKWRILRQNITPVFSSGKIKAMAPVIQKLAEKLNRIIGGKCGQSLDVKHILGRFSLDVIANCVFGIDVNALEDTSTEFYKMTNLFLETSMKSNFKMAFGMLYADVLRVLNVKTMDSSISKYFLGIFRQIIDEKISNTSQKNDFIDMFLKMDSKNGDFDGFNVKTKQKIIEFNELVAQAFLFFVAGYETSTQTMVFCLYELSLNKNIQKKLRDEIKCCRQSYESIMSMEYLDLVVKETLRKYPAAPVLNRKCRQQYKIPDSNLVIEKNTVVWISILGIHMDSKFYEKPDIFDPNRFKKSKNGTKKNMHYLPFGDGPRNCIGARFGLMQIKTTLAALLTNYEFEIDEDNTKTPIEFGPKGILLNTKEIIYLKVHKIN